MSRSSQRSFRRSLLAPQLTHDDPRGPISCNLTLDASRERVLGETLELSRCQRGEAVVQVRKFRLPPRFGEARPTREVHAGCTVRSFYLWR